MHAASGARVQRARRLRAGMTDAEVRLWMRLRMDQIEGCRFRRQVPMGPYVVDFACFKARLVIEVDGGQHAAAVEQDDRRSGWLMARGFRVLRFWNTDVLQDTDGVLDSIRAAILATRPVAKGKWPPHPDPPPQGGREMRVRRLSAVGSGAASTSRASGRIP